MIHETLEISGSHNITGSLLLPLLTEETTLAPGGLAHLDGKTYICNGTNWLQLAETITAAADVEYLVVAGGGGSGGGGSTGYHGGGGGGGGLLSGSIPAIAATFTVTVGAGGSAGAQSGDAGYSGTNGQDSSISGTSITTITSIGGGAGAGNSTTSPASRQGNDGGSGGGGALYSGVGGSGTVGQGNDGGNASANYQGAGGGGGAGTAGGNAVSSGGSGGEGKYNFITGTATYYGGGGAARGQSGNGAAVNGATAANTAGASNKGAGGGGRRSTSGMAGGSGVTIFAYDSGYLSCGGGLVGDAGDGRKYHQFDNSGTFKIGSISDYTVVTDNLKLHLDAGDFDSRGTSTWTDLTSTGYDATLVSSPTLTDYYYNFDGSADYGTFTSTAATDLQNDTQGSIEVWVYGDSFTSGTGRKTIFGTGHSSNTSNWVVLRMHQSSGIQMSVWNGSTSRDFKTDSLPSTGTWLHIVATATSDGTSKIYLNGVSQSITYSSGTAGDGSSRWFSHSSTNTLQVGALDRGSFGNNYDPFDGRIAQVRYYTDVLTDAEVLQNYNATKTNFT